MFSKIPYHKQKKITPWLFLCPFIIAYLAFSLFPLVFSFFISLTKWNGISKREFLGIGNYIKALTQDPYLWKSIFNSVVIGLGYAPLQILVALILANIINSKKARFPKFYQTAIFLPYVSTPVAIGLLCSILFMWDGGTVNTALINLGIIDEGLNWLGDPFLMKVVVMIIMFWQDMGYICVLFLSGLTSISEVYYEAADIDGANSVQKFFRITIPLLKPVFIFVVVNNVAWLFQVFDVPLMLYANYKPAGGPERAVLTPLWYIYDTAFGSNMAYGYASALSYILFILIFAATLFVYKTMGRKENA